MISEDSLAEDAAEFLLASKHPPSFSNIMIPTPRQIFDSFERGEIERDEMQALMALNARELIQEMEEDYQNPAAAWIEGLRTRRAAGLLIRRHGSRLLREVLAALGELPDLPATRHLWNAAQPDVPLHCFLRIQREPVFRIHSLESKADVIHLVVEHGKAARGKGTRQSFLLKRDAQWRMRAEVL